MEATRNLCAQIPASLHDRVREERESLGQSLSEYVTQILREHFEGGARTMNANNRTIAFQVPEELFQRIKDYLHRNNMSQKEFVLGLIETELDREQTERESQIEGESPTKDTCEETDEEAAENGFVGECEGGNSSDEETDTETEDEDESEGFGMTM